MDPIRGELETADEIARKLGESEKKSDETLDPMKGPAGLLAELIGESQKPG